VRELRLAPAVLVGHSMGCRVVLEAARVVGKDVVGLVLVDGSRLGFPGKGNDKAMADRFAAGEYETIVKSMFEQMFTARSDKAKAAAVIERAMRLPNDVGRKMLPDLIRYDADKLDAVLETVAVPLLVIQSTYTNEQRQRMTMRAGETTPYLDLVRGKVRGARVEIVPDTGHFPQIDTPSEVNRLIDTFAAGIGKG
jgi:pimeloyl-ACP methyl ester carboxylesterase